MAYTLTPDQIASVTDVEFVFSTQRLLPKWEDIPEEFKAGNEYTALVEAIFYNRLRPGMGEIELNPGVEPEALNRCIRAHLSSFGPKHEHKIAGVGYMLACASKLVPE